MSAPKADAFSPTSEQIARHAGTTLAALLVIGVALRLFAWGAGSPLWTDEILLGRNIIEHSLSQLVSAPLELDQVAPTGFLFLSKCLTLVFGVGERVLRFVPFVASLDSSHSSLASPCTSSASGLQSSPRRSSSLAFHLPGSALNSNSTHLTHSRRLP